MLKVRGRNIIKRKLHNNRGSTIIETSLIMPIVISICMAVIFIFLDVIGDGIVQGESYEAIYTYTGVSGKEENMFQRPVAGQNGHLYCDGGFSSNADYGYCYKGREVVYCTEYNLCTSRLRRWQLYGDVLWE